MALLAELARCLRQAGRDSSILWARSPEAGAALSRLVESFDVTRAPVTSATAPGSGGRLTTVQWRALALCAGWVARDMCRGLPGAGGEAPPLDEAQRLAWGRAVDAEGLGEDEFRHVCEVLRGCFIRPAEGAAAPKRAAPVRAERLGRRDMTDDERMRLAEAQLRRAMAERSTQS